MPTNSRKRARLWHAVTAVALAAGAVFPGSLVFELHHISTASGVRYYAPEDSSGTFFWEREGMATVAVQGETYPVCRRIR